MLPTLLGARTQQMLATADQLADAIAANNQVELARLLLLLQPESVRGRVDVGLWARRQAAQLGGTAAGDAMRALPRAIAVGDWLTAAGAGPRCSCWPNETTRRTRSQLGRNWLELTCPVRNSWSATSPGSGKPANELRERLVGFFNS